MFLAIQQRITAKKIADSSFIKQTLTREYLSSREKACWKENKEKLSKNSGRISS